MIDTHTHLYFREDYPDGGLEAVERAVESGVEQMILPNVSLESVKPLLELYHSTPPGVTFVAPGLHPEDVDKDWRAKAEEVFAMFEGEHSVAIGEVGVDLYHDATYKFEQMDAFGYQIDKARDMGLPVIVHCRSALDEVLTIVKGFEAAERPGLLFHSFTSGPEEAERIRREIPNVLFGINGVVTFKNAPDLRDAVAGIPVERLVLETDSPYLAPVPKRGRTNESSYLGYIRDKIAELKGITSDEADRITTENARRFFNLPASID